MFGTWAIKSTLISIGLGSRDKLKNLTRTVFRIWGGGNNFLAMKKLSPNLLAIDNITYISELS